MKFVTINQPYCVLTVSYRDKCIDEAISLKFLGIQIDNHITWRNHIDQIIPKLSIWLDKCIIFAIMILWDRFTLLIFTLLRVMD